jgi:threonine dehydratase
VIGVEPEGAPALTRALAAGTPIRLEQIDTIADGLAAPIAGVQTLAHVQAFVDDVVLVSDDDIRSASLLVLERSKLLLEPAGAAGVAALMTGKVRVGLNDHVVCVASGGNFDLKRLKDML